MKQNRINGLLRLNKIPVFYTVLGGVLALTIILCGLGNELEIKEIIKLCVFMGVLIMLIGIYFSIFGHSIRKMPYFNIIFIADFFLAILCIITLDKRSPHSLLLMGGLLIAILFDTYFGIFYTSLLIVFAGIAGTINISYLTYLFIFGILLCFMAPNMKKIKSLGYVLVIALSIQIILLIINNNFGVEDSYYLVIIREVVVALIIIPGSMLVLILYNYCMDKQVDKSTKSEQSGDYSLLEILSESFPLLKKLRETEPKVYAHALMVSEVSGQAAKAVGLNELLAKAGGMYHEVGKIDQDDYLKCGIRYANEYKLPKDVIKIISSHNLKYSKPMSPEGAVVNLTISVLAAKDFLRRNWEETRHKEDLDLNKLLDKAVEELFTMRFTKNSLDESGLTIKQFYDLKQFFLEM